MKFKLTLICIVILGFVFRLYKLSTPLADWHSFRQADTASVTREYVKHGVDLLHPKYHDLSNIQSGTRTGGKDNLDGWRMVEFPLVNALIATILRTFPSLDLVIFSRIMSIIASLISLVGIAYIGKWLFSANVGVFAALFFAFAPYAVFYSRVILPEPFLVMAIVLSLVSLILYEQRMQREKTILTSSALTVLSAVAFAASFSLALLIKPFAVAYLPFFAAIAWKYRGKYGIFDPLLLFLGAGSVIPLLMWRKWIEQFPSGIPASDWLLNGNGIRLRPAWWRWIFYERLTKLIVGYTGMLIFSIGLIRGLVNQYLVVVSGVGILGYLIIVASGNVQHDYYQVITLPWVSLVFGAGLAWGLEQKNRVIRGTIIILGCGALLSPWHQVSGYYNINHWAIVHAGQAADRVLPVDAKVIAPYMGDTAFLFQTNRTGWPIGFEIDKKIAAGATYYVSVNYDDEARELEKKYITLEKVDEYIILDLTKERSK